MAEAPCLLVKTHAFGDAMLCTPPVRELLKKSEGPFWVLAGGSSAPVWERMPGIQELFVAPVPPSGTAENLSFLKWTLRHRRRLREVERSIVFQGSPVVRRWIRYLTGAPMRSVGGKPLGQWEKVFPMEETEYAGLAYSRAAGVEPEDWKPVFSVTDSEKDWVESTGFTGPCFAVAPGGGRNPRDTVLEKRWMPDRFAAVARELVSSGIKVVLVGGPADRGAAEEMQESCGAPLLDMTGRTTWGQTAALLRKCTGFLGADSGAAHLAVAMDLPAVVLFGPSSPECLFAPGLVVPVRSRLKCSPCYSNSLFPGCGRSRPECMEDIDAERVLEAVREVIHQNYNA